MAKEVGVTLNATVIEANGNNLYRVRLDNDSVVLGHLGGKMVKNHIRILVGDRVDIELSPYDLNRGRITYRYK